MPPKLTIPLAAGALGIMVVGVMWQASAIGPTRAAVVLPNPTRDEAASLHVAGVSPPKEEIAVFAGGSFWGVQAVFQHINGVNSAISGYTGADLSNPTFDQVASGLTGEAEAVEVAFDPSVVSYGKLLQVFFSVAHDPTELNRQGQDVGTQYRSEIFTSDPEQADIASAYINQIQEAEVYDKAIVTKVAPLKSFWRAEDIHQDYVALHPDEPYVAYTDLPMVASLHEFFPGLWRDNPVLVLPDA